MTKLADVTFEAASQTGVSYVATGAGSTAARVSTALTGLSGSFRSSISFTAVTGATAYANLNLATISGSSVGLGRSVGGSFRFGSAALFLDRMGLFTLRGGTAGAVFLAGVFTDLTTGDLVLRYNTNSGVVQTSIGNTLKDGSTHTFHLYYLCSSTAGAGQVTLLVDGASVFSSNTISNNTVAYVSGATNVYLGHYSGVGADNALQGSATYDGIYIGDAATVESSSEAGTVISGNTSPIAASARTLTLTTSAGSPSWASSDTGVMTVSGGVVTLQQAAGGVATISDGFGGAVVVEFLPRTLTYTVSGANYSAPTLSHSITLSAVSDGYTAYADIYPSITAPSGVTLNSVSGAASPWTASYTVPSAGTYSININGVTFNVLADSTAPSLSGAITTSTPTTTSYDATCPAATDDTAVTGYQYRLDAGAWVTIGAGGRVASITGRTAGATDALEMRAFDGASNYSTALSLSVTLASDASPPPTLPVTTSTVRRLMLREVLRGV